MKITAVYLLLAIIAVAASLFLSWPEETEGNRPEEGDPLFEEYDPEVITEIELITFNGELNTREQVTLEKKRDIWTIREKSGYHASNTPKITQLTDSLKDRTIFEAPSDQQSDWEEFGVVDPKNEQAQSPGSYGSRLEFKDYNGNEVASLIIGKQVEGNPAQRFVRKPGKPLIYMIEYDYRLLSTDFAGWIDHNILELENKSISRAGKQVSQLQIHSYIINTGGDGTAGNSTPQRKDLYRTEFDFADEQWKHVSTERVDPTGQMAKLTAEQTQQFSIARLQQLHRMLAILPFTNVQQLPTNVTNTLKNREIPTGDIAALKPLEAYGFYFKDAEGGVITSQSSNGHLVVRTVDGVMYRIMFGNIITDQSADSGLKHWMLVRAEIDESMFPEVPAPGDGATEQEKLDFQSNQRARKQKLDAATEIVNKANNEYSQWLYVVEEQYFNDMRPELEMIFPAVNQVGLPAGPQTKPNQ